MKKILSVFLAVLMAAGCFTAAVYAGNDISATNVYTVTVASDSAKKIAIVPETEGQVYVTEGDSFMFTIETLGTYTFDRTTRIRAFPANSYHSEMITDVLDPQYGVDLTPDANGVYTIENVREDIVIAAINLDIEKHSGIKVFVLELMDFLMELIHWFFKVR